MVYFFEYGFPILSKPLVSKPTVLDMSDRSPNLQCHFYNITKRNFTSILMLFLSILKNGKRSIPVRSFFGDLNKKSPLGMIRGCQSDELTPNLDTKEDYT